jgi:ABC-type thiamine transport system ATPase subunit
MFGATNDKDGWRMRTNIEIQELFKQADIVVTIKKGRIRWAGHVQRMAETRSVKKVFFRKT